ncbi:MAG: ABC transporter permease, partial [Candidatus Sericytochromatia bacterium]|nr:ABC transporter permease [Candidatus Tanganyikabacteria bacterium]
MPNLYLRQVLQSAFVLLNVTIAVFVLIRIVPGDPVRLMLGMEASEDAIQAAREQFGYDRPLVEQYVRFAGGALRGDLGQSLRFRRPVAELLMETLPATLELAAAAVGIALLLAVPAGIYAAVHRGGLADRVLMGSALIGQA